MKYVKLPDGTKVPALGQGTWMMGSAHNRATEVAALKEGIALGMTLIDTAEMYGEGAAEICVGEAIKGTPRESLFLVSKAYPQNASRKTLPKVCEASLKRLGTDYLDLYLLHWRGSVPFAETIETMEALQAAGKIRRWGVSNLDTDDMEEWVAAGGQACTTDQILYNLTRRGPEFDLIPWLRKHHMPVMAYSPVEQGRLLKNPALIALAQALNVTPAQLGLAWVMRHPDIMAIPKAGHVAHVKENFASLDIVLDDTILAELDKLFPAPTRKQHLAIL
ncbi:aldo/keto reductase [Zymomonas mobilis]|uniref:aldo/keto reductase n=1 Tax=Zymomonas mobilis TaxID=542 RepID=UPI0003C74B36|nr:aldo/keto reductase [Zymomonas mobilis]AHB10678.1 aldo/keto reductase, diketogulonate reductase [Zymomonas mobilis subsp. mobilis str. CP4 = NRRL B-14023]AHJ70990.1 putative oxidoreductase [Zymomonas mobilis subsp. mobilis NRRL B-12526]AHJ72843.1 putative oxidoreductase [Zymomonas mobilis subsp. mobilis str. CP4 = NRRL B-14023]TWE26054.1 diketogulonate reductase-like aldo/keto reductase [Zymomonas mobilis]